MSDAQLADRLWAALEAAEHPRRGASDASRLFALFTATFGEAVPHDDHRGAGTEAVEVAGDGDPAPLQQRERA